MIPKSKDPSNGFIAAVAAGATVCAIQFLLMDGGVAGANASVGAVLWWWFIVFLITWIVAAFGFVVGLMLIGLPVWAGLSRLGQVSRGSSMAAGALLASLAGGLLGSMGAGMNGGLPSAAFMVLPGLAAGWTLHRVAYGRAASA
ncbi:MAG TPA: hypothetical protein VM348_00690 [Brevundimonas sp.]|nr:hypothetical protein [Brevundimonas sp.]